MASTVSNVVVASATSVTITYTAYTGGSTFTRYGAQYSTDSGANWLPATPTIVTANTTASALTYTSLTAGSTYVFRVSAMNVNTIVSSSVASSPVTMVATPALAPTVVGGNGSITLTLAASLSGAATYTIQRDTANTFNTANLTSVTDVPPGTSYVDNGVSMPFGAKGTTYFYRYRGVATNGTLGVNSAVNTVAVAYATVPDAVTATTAAATTTTAVTVNWSALSAVSTPRTDGGSAITNYRVEYSSDISGVIWTVASAAIASTATSYSVASGLVAGTSYQFRVSALNARGTGAAGSPLICSTLAVAPTAVVSSYVDGSDVATAGNSASGTKMSVSFTAPTNAAAITGYTVYSSVGGLTATGASSPIVITGLTQGTSYTFTVKAATKNSSNADQLSAASVASVARTAALAPNNMGTVSVGTRTTVATPLSWAAVAGNGLTTNYKIERTLGDGVTDVSWSTLVASQTTVTYAGGSLTANNQYTWRITPFTVAGTGSASTATAWTLPNVSITPVATIKAGVADTVTITTTTNVVANQKYRIIPYVGAIAQDGLNGTTDRRGVYISISAALMSQDISGLTVGTSYTIKTQAFNDNGDVSTVSTASAVVVPGIVPGLPTGTLSASAQTSSAITLNGFSRPTALGSYADISNYVVDRALNGTTWTNASSVVVASATSYQFTGLAANTSYWLRIAAKNASGTGPYRYLVVSGDDTISPASAPTGTLPATPATPTASLTNISGDDTINISVVFTSVNGATYRIIPYRDGTEEVTAFIQQVAASSVSTTVAMIGLPGYTSYRFRIEYIGTYGNVLSSYSNVVVPYTQPSTASKRPSGKTYRLYAPNYKEIYWFSYADLTITDASFNLTTLDDGSEGWSVTDITTGLMDKFRGQRSVIFGSAPSSGGNTGPRVVFHGGGSGNSDLEYAYTSTWEPATGTIAVNFTGIAAANGSMLLFAAGETFTRITPSTWQIDRSLTFKTVGDIATRGRATIRFPNASAATWNINYISDNITMEDLIIDGVNNTARTTVLFKCSGPNLPIALLENFTFNRVHFKQFGSKALDFHYVKNITFDGCVLDEVSNSYSIVFTSCKDVIIKNSTIACSNWGTFSFQSSDGPNYLWNNSTSALWSADNATRLAALNNSNIDLTENNTFLELSGTAAKNPNKVPVIEVNIFGRVANSVFNTADAGYQLSLPYSELKLPTGKFGIEYSTPTSYKNLAEAIEYSPNAAARTAQFGTAAVTVTNLATGARIYPVGYEVAPGTPVVTAARHAEGSRVDLSWATVDANDDAGMHATTPYSVSVSPSAGSVSVSGTTASVTGLTNGVEYTFVVTAKNTANLTADSAEVNATPAKIPDAPTSLTFTPHDTSITVSCVPPSGPANIGGNSVAGFRVNVYNASEGGLLLTSVDSSSNNVMVTGLSDNTDYYFSMQVKNDILNDDYSTESVRSAAQRTVTKPGAPSGVSVVAGYKSFTVSWSAPADTGGNATFTYNVKYTRDGIEYFKTGISGESIDISDASGAFLTGGDAYTVFVAALGNVDPALGAYSTGQSVTPFSAPDAPAAPSMTSRTSSSITLSWSAPNARGSTITAYRVLRDGVQVSASISTTSYEVSSLSANTSYSFTVAAYNESGWSDPSDALSAYTLASSPTIARLGGAGRSLIAEIIAPSPSTGILSYGVKVNNVVVSNTGSGTTANFTVASDISQAAVNVYAITAAGNGDDSIATSTSLPLANPADPLSVAAAAAAAKASNIPTVSLTLLNDPTPQDVPRRNAGSNNTPPANATPVLLESGVNQTLKEPVVVINCSDLGDDASVRNAMNAASASGVNKIAITGTQQIGTESKVVTTVLAVSDTDGPDDTVSNTTAPPTDPNFNVTSTVKKSESTGIPVGGKIAMAVEPLIYEENDATQPAPVKKEGISITFKMLNADGTVKKDGFSLKMRVYVPNKTGKGLLDRWHFHDDDKLFHLEASAIEDPLAPGYFEFTQDHNDTVILTNEGSDPNYAAPICFLGNARVLTPAGYCRIDSLTVGDKVQTADGRAVAIQRVVVKHYEPSAAVNPYVIPTGQFGATENLMISPSHRVAVAGRGMIEARKLGLRQMPMRAGFDYYNLELPCWKTDNLVVCGVETESLADIRRIEISMAAFKALLKAKYGRVTPDVMAQLARTCFFTADNKVNIPVLKSALTRK